MTSPSSVSLRVVNHIPAMVAYWDATLKCVFANSAYREWFGREPYEMTDITLEQLLGPVLFAKNFPYIRGVLAGRKQVFERQIPLPSGELRDSIATYTPDLVDGAVLGFSVHVADVTSLRRREDALKNAIDEVIAVLEKTKRSFHSRELGRLRIQLEKIKRGMESREAPGPTASPPTSPA